MKLDQAMRNRLARMRVNVVSAIIISLIVVVMFVLTTYLNRIVQPSLILSAALYAITFLGGIFIAREIWTRRRYLGTIQRPTNEDDVDTIVLQLFTNQEDALRLFEVMITSESPGQRILSVYGVGGIGKSWLLRVYRHRAKSKGLLVTLVDCSSVKSALELMLVIQQDLKDQGFELALFDKKLDRYKQIQSKVSKESDAWKATKLAIGIGKQIPFVGSAARVVEIASSEEFLSWLNSILNKEDVNLYLNPDKTLTEHLVDDIKRVTLQNRVVLLFDTYEQMFALDEWLRLFVSKLGVDTIVVISGQIPIRENWRDLRALAHVFEVHPLDHNASRKCFETYAKRYATNGEQPFLPGLTKDEDRIIEFSGGLPLAISWSVDLMSRYRVSDFGTVRSEVIADLAETMSRAAPSDFGRVLDVCTVFRRFNEDSLKQVLQTDAIDFDYKTLGTLPFMTRKPDGSLAIHDRVRNYRLEELKHRSPRRYSELHLSCAKYYEQIVKEATKPSEITSLQYQKATLEIVYHSLNVSEERGFSLLSHYITEAFTQSQLAYSEHLILEADPYEFSTTNRPWIDYWKGELAYRRGQWFEARQRLRQLYAHVNHTHPVVIPLTTTLGRIHYQQGELGDAKAMYQMSLTTMASLNDMSAEGYVTEQLAKAYRMEGNLQTAVEIHQKAVRIAKEFNSGYQICSNTGSYGTTLMMMGQLREGLRLLSESVDYGRRFGYAQFVCTGLRSRAACQIQLGRLREAEISALESLQIAEQLEDTYNQGFARLMLGQVYVERGDQPETALSVLDRSIVELNLVGAKFDLANAWIAKASCYGFQSLHVNASAAFDEASRLLESLNFAYGMAWLDAHRGRLARLRGDFAESKNALEGAIKGARSIGSSYIETRCLVDLAIVLFQESQLEESEKLLTQASGMAQEGLFHDQLALISLYRGAILLDRNTIEGAFEKFWDALDMSLRYNCFLLERVAREMTLICSSDKYVPLRLDISSRTRMLIARWKNDLCGEVPFERAEIENRRQENTEPSPTIEAVLSVLCNQTATG